MLWDSIRGGWIYEAMQAIHLKQPVPDRTFPEDLTPAELLSLAPQEDREALQTTLLDINQSDAFTSLMSTLYNSTVCNTSLREKIGDSYIQTVKGVGYKYCPKF